jgi:hypothetical protein
MIKVKKPGHLLAWCIKKLNSDRAINEIHYLPGQLSMEPVEINQIFGSYYNTLYSESPENLTNQTSFLDGLDFLLYFRRHKIGPGKRNWMVLKYLMLFQI